MKRRDFLKTATLGAVGAASALALGGCSPTTPDAKNAELGTTGAEFPPGLTAEDFEQSPVVIEPIDDFIETHDYDIVVVGAGTSGMPAALTALEEGASVALLQKETTAIAQGAMSSGVVLSESTERGKLGFMQAYRKECSYRVNTDLLQTFMDHSGECALWMAKMGAEAGFPATSMQFSIRTYLDDQPIALASNIFGNKPQNNQDLCIALANWGEANGLDIFYSTPAVQLVVDNGAVTGVIGKTSDGYIRFNAAKGVILATGDYQNNESLLAKWSPDLVRFAKKQVNKTGDGILLASLAGGHICPVGHSRQMHDNDSCRMNGEPFLAVDVNGERFMNEEIPMASWVCTLLDHNKEGDPGMFCQIFDDNYEDQVKSWGGSPITHEKILNWVPGAVDKPFNVDTSLIDTHFCDTLDELAEVLDIPADALKKSVERYNELVAAGADDDFGKDVKYLKPIDTPPYWGIRRWVRLTATCNGIAVDGNYQVIDDENQPIADLYAVGFGAGNLCGGVDWSTYLSGMSCGSCMTSGRIAALHALTGQLEPSNPVTWEDVKDMYTIM
ncbi:FAD-dependent oxidoreductase [Adlercreutzia agrestimuris]|uniref:FAD-dependent oxidoreductase n=1 Tax=Adlercreutzia agrestimuris TaxID=2941324 RepID=UPI00203F0C05|nr:FAD-dependent oxidoreductase [Adlercreutzia agrestimuris]